jgi:hypothetical protein
MLDGISMLSAAVNARVTTCTVDWTSMLTTSPCRRAVCNVNASLPQQQKQQQQHFHYTLQMILFSEKSRQTAHRNRPAANLHLRTRLPPSTTPGPSQSSIFFPISVGLLLSKQNVGCETGRRMEFLTLLAHEQYGCIYHLPLAAK